MILHKFAICHYYSRILRFSYQHMVMYYLRVYTILDKNFTAINILSVWTKNSANYFYNWKIKKFIPFSPYINCVQYIDFIQTRNCLKKTIRNISSINVLYEIREFQWCSRDARIKVKAIKCSASSLIRYTKFLWNIFYL